MKGRNISKYKLIFQHLKKEYINPNELAVKAVNANESFSPIAVYMAIVFCDTSLVIFEVSIESYQETYC